MFHSSMWPLLALLHSQSIAGRYVSDPLEGPARGRELVQVRQEVDRATQTARAEVSFITASTWFDVETSKQPLSWQPFRYFPALPLRQPVASCPNIGRQYPELVSRNQSILSRYASIVCDNSRNSSFLTDPTVPLTAELADLQGGCINMNRWPSRMLAANQTHSVELGRTCGEACDQDGLNLMRVMVDDDVLVITSTELPAGMEYQHMLMDFLPPAWTVVKKLKKGTAKLLTHIPLQREIMEFLGVPKENILELPFPKENRFLLCTHPSKTLHLWRTGRSDGEPLPMRNEIGGFTDFWHRLLDFRVAPELSNALAKSANLDPWQALAARQVTFLHRCVERRRLVNEEQALAVTSKALIEAKQPEELVSMCAGRRTWLEQFKEIRKSALLIGAHGGSLANAVYARHGTGIIEIVNSPEAHNETESGIWPPYKSFWYGGAGAALPFFRVVLYERNAADELEIRTDDLEAALYQWFAYKADLKAG